jgi:2-keto-3-deoxy-L-rhamnonate aldolase RhmA
MKQPNRVKAAMRAGRKAYGYNLSFPSPWVIDILGKLDFDFVFIDGEHGRLAWTSSRTSAGPPSAIT